MDNLPFELSKHHKSQTRYRWTRYGMNFIDKEHFEYIYNEYIHATNCDLCNKLFPKSQDRQLDHCHNTGDPRNIVCCRCNSIRNDTKKQTNTGEDNIYKCKHKEYKTGYCFRIQIIRNYTSVFVTSRKTLEEAIKCRDDFLKNNPGIYT